MDIFINFANIKIISRLYIRDVNIIKYYKKDTVFKPCPSYNVLKIVKSHQFALALCSLVLYVLVHLYIFFFLPLLFFYLLVR